jgi:hypothetical protein
LRSSDRKIYIRRHHILITPEYSNSRAWKTRIDLILSKNKVLDIAKGNIVEPQNDAKKEKESQNKAEKEKFMENDIHAMGIIVESIRYHLIPYISNMDTSKKIYDALTNLFIVKNVVRVMSLKNELRDTRMTKDDTISSYFVRISQLRDQIQAINEVFLDKEIMIIALNGLLRPWDAFASSMNTRKEFPTFEELWTYCAQEESRITSKEIIQKEEDVQAYATRFKKNGGKKKSGFQSKKLGRRPNHQEKIDMSKVQCFGCWPVGLDSWLSLTSNLGE